MAFSHVSTIISLKTLSIMCRPDAWLDVLLGIDVELRLVKHILSLDAVPFSYSIRGLIVSILGREDVSDWLSLIWDIHIL